MAVTITTTQAALVAALAAARGVTQADLEAAMGLRPSALRQALKRGPLPRAGAQHATGQARLTAEAVAGALGVDVGVLLGDTEVAIKAIKEES